MYEYRFLENIHKLYTYPGKCDDQHHYKDILEELMVYTPEKFTDNSPMSPGHFFTFKNTSARKSLRTFTETLDVKNKTAVSSVCADKLKLKEIRSCSILW